MKKAAVTLLVGVFTIAPVAHSGGSGGILKSAVGVAGGALAYMGINAAVGSEMSSICPTPNAAACALAVMSFAQAAADMASGSQASKTGSASASGANGFKSSFADAKSIMDSLTPDQKAAFQSVLDAGYKPNANGTVTGPDGKIWTAADFASKESLMAAGVSAGAAGSLQMRLSEINQEASAKAEKALGQAATAGGSLAIESGGGGGGRRPSSDGSSEFDSYMAKFRNPFGLDPKQREQMVAGKTISHGEDTIGVKVDNIFDMVHRRYQDKREDEEFLEMPAPAAAAPRPTVVTPNRRR